MESRIGTDRLTLRPFEAGDVADAVAYRDDLEFARFLPHIPQPLTWEDGERFVRQNMCEPLETSVTFAVVLDGVVIGTVNLEVDAETRSAMIGYAIGRRWWGKGIAVEAAKAVMEWGIAAFGLKRVWAATDVRNGRSRRVLEKLAMTKAGMRRGETCGREGEAIEEVVYEVGA